MAGPPFVRGDFQWQVPPSLRGVLNGKSPLGKGGLRGVVPRSDWYSRFETTIPRRAFEIQTSLGRSLCQGVACS